MYPTTNGGVREAAAPMNALEISNVSNEIQVDHNQNVRKLPNGINEVTMMRPGKKAIQVKLPFTGKTRFLSYYSVI